MSLSMAYGIKKRSQKKMAFGGEAEEEDANSFQDGMSKMMGQEPAYAEGGEVYGTEDRALDLVGRIMESRRSAGSIANDVGVAEADELPAEYDDLVLRDDFKDDAPAGNEIGDEEQEERDDDVVGKIMSSRKKKDRNPRQA